MTDQTLDELVARYLDLTTTIEELTAARDGVKDQIREVGVGEHATSSGVKVVVSPPSRRFDPKKAEQMLAPEVLELCKADGYDPKKLKSFLAPVLLDACMVAGTGAPTVRVG